MWIRSTFCDNNLCVEVSIGYRVAVRDAADPGQWLVFSHREWTTFLAGLREEEPWSRC